jgi:hypothetical protein
MADTTKKRKSETLTSNSKKSRTADNNDSARALINEILANANNYPIPEDETATRHILVSLAQYARNIEQGAVVKKKKTREEIRDAAKKLASACNSGIRKQMQVVSSSLFPIHLRFQSSDA